VEPSRLAETVARLKERLRAAQPAANTEALLQELAASLQRSTPTAPLRWVRASVGQTVHLIPVDAIDFLRSDQKYTLVAWRDDAGKPREAVIRTPLKDISAQLDSSQFAQVYRSVVVNLSSIDRVTRGANETADIHLKGRNEVLPVSRNYVHVFRQM
jgi:DNA-binding LytR/AlgR family response regulator